MPDRKPIRETTPSPIDDAIDRVAQRGHERALARIPMLTQPHSWPDDAQVTLTAPADPEEPVMLLWEETEKAFRVIILPPGSEWEVRRRAQGPSLWTPPVGPPS